MNIFFFSSSPTEMIHTEELSDTRRASDVCIPHGGGPDAHICRSGVAGIRAGRLPRSVKTTNSLFFFLLPKKIEENIHKNTTGKNEREKNNNCKNKKENKTSTTLHHPARALYRLLIPPYFISYSPAVSTSLRLLDVQTCGV